jgi:1-acyl-sn-glycerol-3-phosphate acyltransferase
MVDIEPTFKYDFSQVGIKTIYHILIIFFLTYIYPIYLILSYNVKTEKKCIKNISKLFIDLTKPIVYQVSKDDLNISKNIMYMSNHLSVSDFFIDPLVTHYNSKYISLNKMRQIFPFLGLLTTLSKYCIFISGDKRKEQVIEDLKKIEELRIEDTCRNLAIYPEGMRRPHRPYVSEQLKKGFIYHSFEHNIPIQIIHTTNKDYVIDDQKLKINNNMKLFTYYSPLIDPLQLKKKFEKREKREYTKDDYYNDFYKIWSKVWKRMDKYRIDIYRKQGMSFDEAVQKIDDIAECRLKKKQLSLIENTIQGEDKEINKTFIFIRNLVWGVIYYGIYKIIGVIFDIFFKFRKSRADICSSTTPINSIIGKILCLPKTCVSLSTDSISTMSNIMNQNVCSPECSPKRIGTGIVLPQSLLNLNLNL